MQIRKETLYEAEGFFPLDYLDLIPPSIFYH